MYSQQTNLKSKWLKYLPAQFYDDSNWGNWAIYKQVEFAKVKNQKNPWEKFEGGKAMTAYAGSSPRTTLHFWLIQMFLLMHSWLINLKMAKVQWLLLDFVAWISSCLWTAAFSVWHSSQQLSVKTAQKLKSVQIQSQHQSHSSQEKGADRKILFCSISCNSQEPEDFLRFCSC